MRKEEWWQTRYGTPKKAAYYYESHREDLRYTICEVETYLRYFPPINNYQKFWILDGYAGNARHGLELRKRGFPNVISFDYSLSMLEQRKKIMEKDQIDVMPVSADARFLPFPREFFDVYQIPNTSFIGLFSEEEDNERVIEEAYRVLKPGGILIFDLVDSEYALRALRDIKTTNQRNNGITVYTQRKTYQVAEKIFTEFLEQIRRDGQVINEEKIIIRVFRPEEVREMLVKNKFSEIQFVSKAFCFDPDGKILGTRGVRNLYIAKK